MHRFMMSRGDLRDQVMFHYLAKQAISVLYRDHPIPKVHSTHRYPEPVLYPIKMDDQSIRGSN
ncbi:hypothetical protein B0O80DRAFT_432427 [Mortierella sp. GBAus27b]|nr:hypothetical protein B0O80DRAFT_432427 [Mortierella sp. GBAus27b]